MLPENDHTVFRVKYMSSSSTSTTTTTTTMTTTIICHFDYLIISHFVVLFCGNMD